MTNIHSALQLAFALSLIAGVFLLLGLAWAMTLVGLVGIVASVLLEGVISRGSRSNAQPRD